MKSTLYLFPALLLFASCKTAFISSYQFSNPPQSNDGFYNIHLESKSFERIQPITASTTETDFIDGLWDTDSDEIVVGYALSHEERSAFEYLLERAINPPGARQVLGDIVVQRLQHAERPDFALLFTIMTLWTSSIVGLPISSSEIEDAYLFEVFNTDGELIYRRMHEGRGKAKCGLYYGYFNLEEKAAYDAAFEAIESFVKDFQ